jgi:hypothetical protein
MKYWNSGLNAPGSSTYSYSAHSSSIYLLGFFWKYECCWVINLIMFLHHFILFWFYFILGCLLPFCITRFHTTMKCLKQFKWSIFLNEICFINIQIINFNSFKSYKNEILKKLIWKIMQELIKIKHVNF